MAPWVRTQLEMGGKNALVVWEDADLDKAADIVAKGAFGLSGQACTGTRAWSCTSRCSTVCWTG